MTEENLDSVFESLFGKDERSEDQRKFDEQERHRNRNESEERSFERERDRRAEYFHMDQRIRNIVHDNINQLIITGLVFAGIVWVVFELGWIAGFAAFSVVYAYWWWDERQQKNLPRFRLEGVDDLAEDTVTHERIYEMAEASENWIKIEGGYVEWGDVFHHPYWKRVNDKVRTYVSMSHRTRVEDNATARALSLPYRVAKTTELKAMNGEFELPYRAKV